MQYMLAYHIDLYSFLLQFVQDISIHDSDLRLLKFLWLNVTATYKKKKVTSEQKLN